MERRIAALPEPLADSFRLAKDETPALTQARAHTLPRESVPSIQPFVLSWLAAVALRSHPSCYPRAAGCCRGCQDSKVGIATTPAAPLADVPRVLPACSGCAQQSGPPKTTRCSCWAPGDTAIMRGTSELSLPLRLAAGLRRWGLSRLACEDRQCLGCVPGFLQAPSWRSPPDCLPLQLLQPRSSSNPLAGFRRTRTWGWLRSCRWRWPTKSSPAARWAECDANADCLHRQALHGAQ